jgi:hypothetical protein
VNKKMRYAMGAVGAMPALAMVPAQFATPAVHTGKTTATSGKKVRTIFATDTAFATTTSSTGSAAISPNVGSCTGTNGHHNKHSDVTVRFYSKPALPNRTCIGTIKVSDSGFATSSVGAYIQNSNGIFCQFSVGKTVASHRCRRVFEDTNGFNAQHPLTVVGFGINVLNVEAKVFSTIPFPGKGF